MLMWDQRLIMRSMIISFRTFFVSFSELGQCKCVRLCVSASSRFNDKSIQMERIESIICFFSSQNNKRGWLQPKKQKRINKYCLLHHFQFSAGNRRRSNPAFLFCAIFRSKMAHFPLKITRKTAACPFDFLSDLATNPVHQKVESC